MLFVVLSQLVWPEALVGGGVLRRIYEAIQAPPSLRAGMVPTTLEDSGSLGEGRPSCVSLFGTHRYPGQTPTTFPVFSPMTSDAEFPERQLEHF